MKYSYCAIFSKLQYKHTLILRTAGLNVGVLGFCFVFMINVIMVFIGYWNPSWGYNSNDLGSVEWYHHCLRLWVASHSTDFSCGTSDNGRNRFTD